MYEYIQAYIKHLLPYLHLPGEKACRSSCWTHSMFLLLVSFLWTFPFFCFDSLSTGTKWLFVCLCCGRISNYNCRIKFMAFPPISLPPPSLYDKTFRNTCIRTIWNVELCWIDTVGFYSLCFKKLGDICDENITAKVKNLETDRHIYIFAMHIVSPVVFMKS